MSLRINHYSDNRQAKTSAYQKTTPRGLDSRPDEHQGVCRPVYGKRKSEGIKKVPLGKCLQNTFLDLIKPPAACRRFLTSERRQLKVDI